MRHEYSNRRITIELSHSLYIETENSIYRLEPVNG